MCRACVPVAEWRHCHRTLGGGANEPTGPQHHQIILDTINCLIKHQINLFSTHSQFRTFFQVVKSRIFKLFECLWDLKRKYKKSWFFKKENKQEIEEHKTEKDEVSQGGGGATNPRRAAAYAAAGSLFTWAVWKIVLLYLKILKTGGALYALEFSIEFSHYYPKSTCRFFVVRNASGR